MSVLLDVLNIAKGKHYMVLDAVQQDHPESRTSMHLLAKKKVSIKYLDIVVVKS